MYESETLAVSLSADIDREICPLYRKSDKDLVPNIKEGSVSIRTVCGPENFRDNSPGKQQIIFSDIHVSLLPVSRAQIYVNHLKALVNSLNFHSLSSVVRLALLRCCTPVRRPFFAKLESKT